MEVLLIALLTLLNGVFAMSEMGLASSRKARLATLAEAGDRGGGGAAADGPPTRFLRRQVGITSIGVLNGMSAKLHSARSATGCRRLAWAALKQVATALW
jgi:putative hemolysin